MFNMWKNYWNLIMRNKIYTIIIDSNRNWNNLIQRELPEAAEKEILVTSLTSDTQLGNNMKQVDAIITIGNEKNSYKKLSSFRESIQRRWVHFDKCPSQKEIRENIIKIFKNNIRNYTKNEIFSIITPTYNTTLEEITRLYKSLVKQTYIDWDWWILDDSTNNTVIETLESLDDSRIYIFKNISHKGNIGFNKSVLGSMCSGSYIVEVDHDDELTSDCLQVLHDAFKAYPGAGFAYSHACEMNQNGPADYGDGWGLMHGTTRCEVLDGKKLLIAVTPHINCETLRMGWTCPNHVRAWKRDAYNKLHGHNRDLSIADDYELTIRTFLSTRMIRIDKALYIQHHETLTESYRRIKEIARTLPLTLSTWDTAIHNRISEIDDAVDLVWDKKNNCSLPMDTVRYSAVKPLSYDYKP